MNAREFIYSELYEFIREFPKSRIRYEYDKDALVHIIEVLPNDLYNIDSCYIRWENDFYNRFIDLFQNENVCFISNEALVGITTPELVLEGLEFSPITSQKMFSASFVTQILYSVNNCYYNITYSKNNNANDFEKVEIIPNKTFDDLLLNAA